MQGTGSCFKLLLDHLFGDFSVDGDSSGSFGSALMLESLHPWPYCFRKPESRTVRLVQKQCHYCEVKTGIQATGAAWKAEWFGKTEGC